MTNSAPISYEEHFSFIRKLIGNQERWYLAVYENKQLLATLNYTKDVDGQWERGIIVVPPIRGKHLAGQIEQIVYPLLRKRKITSLKAKVRQSNMISRHYHESIGYNQISCDDDYCYYNLFL